MTHGHVFVEYLYHFFEQKLYKCVDINVKSDIIQIEKPVILVWDKTKNRNLDIHAFM